MFDFTGYGENLLTFKTEEEGIIGAPVKVVSDDTVGAAKSGDAFCGIAISARGGAAAVQMSGYITIKYSGDTAPTHGAAVLAADGNGGVCVNETGVKVTVIRVDEDENKVSFIF